MWCKKICHCGHCLWHPKGNYSCRKMDNQYINMYKQAYIDTYIHTCYVYTYVFYIWWSTLSCMKRKLKWKYKISNNKIQNKWIQIDLFQKNICHCIIIIMSSSLHCNVSLVKVEIILLHILLGTLWMFLFGTIKSNLNL